MRKECNDRNQIRNYASTIRANGWGKVRKKHLLQQPPSVPNGSPSPSPPPAHQHPDQKPARLVLMGLDEEEDGTPSKPCPTRYSSWSTGDLLGALWAWYGMGVSIDAHGRLILTHREYPPVPRDFHEELRNRMDDIRRLMLERRQTPLEPAPTKGDADA